MTPDIVNRLQNRINLSQTPGATTPILCQAAIDEITTLRAKLEIAEALQDSAYIAGTKAGWNAAQLEPDEAKAKMESLTAYQGHLRALTTHTGQIDERPTPEGET